MGFGGKGGGGFDFDPADRIDPAALIRQQAEANRIDVRSPTGSALFSGPNRRELDITLSPGQQAIFDTTEATQGQLANLAQALAGQISTDPISFDGLQSLPGINDFEGARQAAPDAAFARVQNLLNPQFEADRAALQENLAARGLTLGQGAGGREFGNLLERQGRAFTDAALAADQLGSAEQARLFGQALTARQQGIGERQLEINDPFNRVAALLGQTQVQQPTVLPPAPIDVVGPHNLASNQALTLASLNQQGRLANQQAGLSALNSVLGLGGAVGSAALLNPGLFAGAAGGGGALGFLRS